MSTTVYGAGFSHLARKNTIINGDMRIAQRGTSFVAIANGEYSLDRWKYQKVGTMVLDVTQDSDIPSDQFGYSMKLDVTTADASMAVGDWTAIQYRIEGYDFKKFVGQTATLSFWIKSSKIGTMSVSFVNSGVDRSYVTEITVDSTNTWEKKTITLNFDYSGGTWGYNTAVGLRLNFVLAASQSGTWATSSLDQWLTGNYVNSDNQTNFVDNTANNMWITGVQLELGNQATEFEFIDFESELACCLRYWEKSYNYNTALGTNIYNGAAYFQAAQPASSEFTVIVHVWFRVHKRIAPSISYWDKAGNISKVTNLAIYKDNVAGTVLHISQTGFNLGAANPDNKRGLVGHWVADAEL